MSSTGPHIQASNYTITYTGTASSITAAQLNNAIQGAATGWKTIGYTAANAGTHLTNFSKKARRKMQYLWALKGNGTPIKEDTKVRFQKSTYKAKTKTLYDVYLDQNYIGSVYKSLDRSGWTGVTFNHTRIDGMASRQTAALYILDTLGYYWELRT